MQTFCGLITDGMLDYLVAIYALIRDQGKVTTTALADKMHVSSAAASSMLKRLEESQHICRSNVNGIKLTEQGRLAAMQLLRRHRLLEVFLLQVMEFTWDQVDTEAHRLEHAISSAFVDRMDKICGYPTHCPHGDPIPTKDGKLPDEQLVALAQLSPGESGVIRRIGSSDASVLRYLGQLKLKPGRVIKMVEMAPFKGPITIELINLPAAEDAGPTKAAQILGSELAAQIFLSSTVAA